MSIVYHGGSINAGENNNYRLANTITSSFAIGNLGSPDDFFLVGVEPEQESNYPLLTGNVLDSEGDVLFRLVRNVLVINPGQCSKIHSDHIGYEIHDSAGKLVFKVETKFEFVAALERECFLTSISGKFYNKDKELICDAEQQGPLSAHCPHAIGYKGGTFASVCRMDEETLQFASLILATGGKVNQPLRGLIENQTIDLDGKALINATLRNCKLSVDSGDFILIGNNTLDNSDVQLSGPAQNVAQLVAGRNPFANK